MDDGLRRSLLAGDHGAVEEGILESLKDARRTAWRLARRLPGDRYDDFKMVGYLAVVQAINNVVNGSLSDDNVERYVRWRIRRAIVDYASTDELIKIPRKKKRQHFKESGDNLRHTTFAPLDGVPGLPNRPDAQLRFREELERVAITDREREVVNLRIQGYTNKEIAEHLGFKPPNVVYILRKIQERWSRGLRRSCKD